MEGGLHMAIEKHDISGSMKNTIVPVKEKYTLTIKEAAAYFNIGIKKMRRIAEDNLGTVAVYCGNRFLIIRPKFEEFILNSSEI
jgi:spore coat polysaccharide biosynthesis predicted glycosyltransferase SpsG